MPLSELIAVPSCWRCNDKFARDDELLRDVLVSATLHVDMPELAAPRAAMTRSLARKQFAGPIKRMIGRKTRTYAPLGGSPVLQPAWALPVDRARLERVLQRIVRGLFFHETGRRIPSDYLITAADQNLVNSAPTYDRPFFANIIASALEGEQRAVGGRRFGYCYRVLRDDPLGSVWLLSFLGQLVFLCTACRRP
ncbi:MAG: hypothetical protein KGJ68_06275 [Gammaproteobacteria bacterium]|nr:hypothetical protein [Gammaproteobacteria bacterium]